MNVSIFFVSLCLYYITASGLNFTISGNTTLFQVLAPPLFLQGQSSFPEMQNLTLHQGADATGCSDSAFNGSGIWMVTDDTCTLATKIHNAQKSRVTALIILSDNNIAGIDVKIGTIGTVISRGDIAVVEVNIHDGQMLKSCISKGCIVSLNDGDYNAWLEFDDSWKTTLYCVILTAIFGSILLLAIYKMIKILWDVKTGYQDSRSFLQPLVVNTFLSMTMVIITCIICLLSVAVDPINSRGIYPVDLQVELSTLYLPTTFLGTFLSALGLLVVLGDRKTVIQGRTVLVRIFRVLIGFGLVAFIIEIALGIARASATSSATIPRYITVIFYVASALSVIVFYIYVYTKAPKVSHREKNKKKRDAGSAVFLRLNNFLKRNIWFFSAMYGAWILMAIVLTIYQISPKMTPTIRCTIYFFEFLIIAAINFYHTLLVRTRRLIGNKDSKSTSDVDHPSQKPQTNSVESHQSSSKSGGILEEEEEEPTDAELEVETPYNKENSEASVVLDIK